MYFTHLFLSFSLYFFSLLFFLLYINSQLSEGWLQDAARTLSRRIDPGSLFVAGQLYQASGRSELAMAMGTAALREAALRQEMTRIEPFLAHMPELSVSFQILWLASDQNI